MSSDSENRAPNMPAPGIMDVDFDEEPTRTPRFDWLVELAIPVAVFGLLGCFLYYLVDLRSALGGEAGSFLRWVCFWFLLASIAIVRIRTKYGDAVIALPYLVGLFAATFLAITAFTGTAGAFMGSLNRTNETLALMFNLSLVVLIWWLASMVTRECTAEDEEGQEERPSLWATLVGGKKRGRHISLTPLPPAPGRRHLTPLPPSPLVERGNTAAPAKQRNPQRQLLYLSAIVLAVFAFGQRFIGDKGIFAKHAFLCMVGYLFFVFLLLALTNLSSLRVEARRRKLQVSRSLAPSWITATTVLVVAILAVSALIPRMRGSERLRATNTPSWSRPGPKTPWTKAPAAGIAEPPRTDSTDPNPVPGTPTTESPRNSETSAGKAGTGGERTAVVPGGTGKAPGSQTTETPPQGGGQAPAQGQGHTGQGKGQEKGTTGQGGQSQTGAGQAQSQAGGGGGAGGQTQMPDPTGSSGAKPNEKSDREAGGDQGTKETPAAPEFNWLLWLLLLLLALIIAYLIYRKWDVVKVFLARAWQAFLAPFIALAEALRRLWQRFMDFLNRARRRDEEPGEVALPVNPFEDIFQNRYLLENLSPAQMATHVYRAFMALCDLRGYGRRDEQTEREFLRSVPDNIGVQRPDREGITGMYLRARYSPSSVGPDVVPTLEDYWSRLRPAIDGALAAHGGRP